MTPGSQAERDVYLGNFSILANVLFALCMFSSVLKVDFADPDLSDRELVAYIIDNLGAFVNFVVAFLFLSMYWIKFIGRQAHLVRSNNPLLIIWLLYLGLLCVYVFGENLIGTYPDSPVAQVAFSAIWAIIGIVGLVSWWYADHAGLLNPELSTVEVRRITWESIPEPVAALVSIPFAFYSGLGYYLALLLVIPANYYILRRFRPAG